MLEMSTDKWIFLLALCFMCVASNDAHTYEDYFEDDHCEKQALNAPLGSSVFLPCNLATSSEEWVTWAHNHKMDLVELSSEGRVKFLDPRRGRVKAFPNQASEGNYSICIDELETSDQGYYRCMQGGYCLQVELLVDSTLSTEMKLLIYSIVGVTALILLSFGGYFCCKKCIAGARAPPEGTSSSVVYGEQTGSTIYA